MRKKTEPIRDPEKTREYIDWCIQERVRELMIETMLQAIAGD